MKKFDFTRIPYEKTGIFKSIVLDYLNQEDFLRNFCDYFPDWDSFDQKIEKEGKRKVDRKTLVDTLKRQYADAGIRDEIVNRQISQILSENTFTVTTGQQAGIFLGPLYTTYKILSTIFLSRQLQDKFPDKNFIPVFYLATEDHDLEEIRHITIHGKKYSWDITEKGPAGHISTESLLPLIGQIRDDYPSSMEIDDLLNIFERAYKGNSLSAATRIIIHQLFGKYGMLVIDPDDQALKSIFAPIIKKDILEKISFHAVQNQSKILEKKYKIQAGGREINYFYLNENYRERIVSVSGGYATADGLYSWDESKLLTELDNQPHHFSPNVITRPLYQETILPNIAYIGGGAEIAYWLELKGVFDSFSVPFPVFLLRKSFLMLNAEYSSLIEKLGIDPNDLFLSKDQLTAKWFKANFSDKIDFEDINGILQELKNELFLKASAISPSKLTSARAMTKRWENDLERFNKKLIRQLKKEEPAKVTKLNAIIDFVNPGGGLQERTESIFTPALFGFENCLECMLQLSNPLENKLIVINNLEQENP